jgi:conserved oligomeric Golgi complex subunit 2
MNQFANGAVSGAAMGELTTTTSRHSSLTNNISDAQTPTFPLSSANVASPMALPQTAPAATQGVAAVEADPEVLKQQLELIQLCFAEHEFGIIVDESTEKGGNSSGSSSNTSSSSSSPSSSRSSSASSLSAQTESKGTAEAAAASVRPVKGVGRRHYNHHRHSLYSNYDPLTFVNGKVRHGVPLAVLSQDLHSYAQYLEDKIAACVNTDVHTAFVSVSGHLVGMRDELSYMERPLTAAMEKLSGAVGQLAATAAGVKNKVEAACAAEMERNFDSVFLRGIVVYETIAYQLDDLAQELHITVDPTPSRSPAAGGGALAGAVTEAGTAVGGSGSGRGVPRTSAAHDVTHKGSVGGGRKDVYVIAAGTRLSDAALDVLEDVVLLFQELKEVSQRLIALPSRQQEKAEMAGYVAAAEQSVMGVLEVVLVYVSRMAFGVTGTGGSAVSAADSAPSGTVSAAAEGVESGSVTAAAGAADAPSPAVRQLLGRVIELYSQAGEREHFCAVFRSAVLRPPLEAVVSWKAATQARQSAEGTVALLEQMKTVLQNKYFPLLPLLRQSYGAPLHPVATIVWPILSETLVKKLPSLYEVGIPNQFQIKYKAAYNVLALVEAACVDLEELAVLRQSPDVVLWNHKWNLDVYAALRVSEVDKALQSVSSPLDRLPSSTQGDYHLRLFYIVHQQLLHLFSPSVFLYLCTPRFLRQTVTCCYRVLQRVQEAIARAPADSAKRNSSAYDTAANGANGSGSVEAESTTPAADAAAPSVNDTLLVAISDTRSLRSFLTGQLLPLILERLNGESLAPSTAAESAVAQAAAGTEVASSASERSTAALVGDVVAFASNTVCGKFIEQARSALVRHVTDAAMGPLQNVKSVRSAYSHTRKTMPSVASWYINPVLQPLQRFAEEARRCGFTGAACEEAVVEMLHLLVRQFVVLSKDTLITAKKTEESWEKLRRRKEGGGGGAGGSGAAETVGEGPAAQSMSSPQPQQRVTMETATDRDKMTIQLWMDARALWQAVQQPPLSVAESSATEVFAPAFELLRRAEWIQGADIPEPLDVDA